jgi:hypothetical protein
MNVHDYNRKIFVGSMRQVVDETEEARPEEEEEDAEASLPQ